MVSGWSALCLSNLFATRFLQLPVAPSDSCVVRDMRATASLAVRPATRFAQPVVIGHRGAPAYRPEHTAASYQLAIDLGAELIEPVAGRVEFAARRTTKEVDGHENTGWFAEDFTLAELRTLRAVERMPELRPLNTAYDGHFGILTLGEVISLARTRSTDDRPIRVLAELKHADWSTQQGLPMAELVADELRRLDATGASGPVMVQSFEPTVLRDVRTLLGDDGPQMVQLVADNAAGDRMVTRPGLREISTYAQGIGPSRERILGTDGRRPSALVEEAHRAALSVFCWTLRAENAFLPEHLRVGDAPHGLGDALAEARQLLALGVDGLITDSPDHAVQAIAELCDLRSSGPHRGQVPLTLS
jgi:glycerophosphoryl diester phosphodiesterase